MFTVETQYGVDLVPPVLSESRAIECALLSSRIVRGGVGVVERDARGAMARYVGMVSGGVFVRVEG